MEASRKSSHFAYWISTFTSPCREVVMERRSLIKCFSTKGSDLRSWHMIDQAKSSYLFLQSILVSESTCPRTTTLWSSTHTGSHHQCSMVNLILQHTIDLNRTIPSSNHSLVRDHPVIGSSRIRRIWEWLVTKISLALRWTIFLAKVISKICYHRDQEVMIVIQDSLQIHRKESSAQGSCRTQACKC